MNAFTITIDGRAVPVAEGESVLAAARRAGIEIPTLCYLEQCGPLTTCLVCLVKINGRLVPSCGTKVAPGMAVESETPEVHEARRTALELLFSDHVGDCLSPCHRLCPLELNVPVMLRAIQAGRLDEAATEVRRALPLPAVLGRLCHHPCEQGCRRAAWDNPAAIRDMERFVADWDLGRLGPHIKDSDAPARPEPFAGGEPRPLVSISRDAAIQPTRPPHMPPRKPPSGKSVVIIGAGPAGLAAAHFLAREGHAVVVADRHARPGGSLRAVPETELPPDVLDAELALLERLGVQFQTGVELGRDLTLDGLMRGFDAVLLAPGELSDADAARIGLPFRAGGIECDPNSGQTRVPKVFAAGSAVRPVRPLVRAMAEGRAVAVAVNAFLQGRTPRRPEKPFSSVIGRLQPGELREFLRHANAINRVTPCDRCLGHTPREAALEASRCLHCDCRSSGECLLQHWAQVYGADANRFRSERRVFEQREHPGGILFEPGKCILCGICVKLAEQAREPLGLTFIGRGFDVRVGVPFNEALERGLQKVAAECVLHCPTGALAFANHAQAPTSAPRQPPADQSHI
jgi:ferredoxin